MFERFTPRARRVLVVAQEEAKTLRHSFIGPEHILIGLAQGDGVAAKALGRLGVSLEEVRAKVAETVKSAKSDVSASKVPFSPKAKKALEMSLREALRLGHNYIGTEHLLLGVLRVGADDGTVAQLLGVDADAIRTRVLETTPDGASSDSAQSPAALEAARLAHQSAGTAPVTTGQLLLAMLADPECQASKALGSLGVSQRALESELTKFPAAGTSDAPPRPLVIEIKLGESTTTIGDPALAAALVELSPAQLHAALRNALGADPEQPESASGN